MISAVWVLAASSDDAKTAFDFIAPIASTGLVGIILLMIIFRYKLMPTYVHDQYREDVGKQLAAKDADILELKSALSEAQKVYTAQVIPTLTRVLDAERELVDLRRDEQAERRRRGRD